MLHVLFVEDVVLQHLVRLGVGTLALPLGDVDIAFLVLEQEELGFGDDDVLAHQIALVDDCHVEDCELLDGLGARLGEECSTSVYLSCRRSVDLSGSVLNMTKW